MFTTKRKVPVAVLGATGSVGQRFVQLLADHPWFEIASLAASERSVGKRYGEAVNWLLPEPMPRSCAEMVIVPCDPGISGEIAFSALDSSIALSAERAFAADGWTVITNASSHRMDPDVPLLIPEVNGDHLKMVQDRQGGIIIANPNCCAIGLCLSLKPLYDRFGLEAVHVVTMQAISGAGYPGLASLDIMDNVIPSIAGEEHKLETEPLKIFGHWDGMALTPASFAISAQCNRVAVTDGHMECVSVKLQEKVSSEEMIRAWSSFDSMPQRLNLPTAPKKPIYYFDDERYPQPRLHRNLDQGMAVSIGRFQKCGLLDFKFVLLSHNTIRGAAGGALLCAESLLAVRYGDSLISPRFVVC